MYTCQLCAATVAPLIPACRVVVATRSATYLVIRLGKEVRSVRAASAGAEVSFKGRRFVLELAPDERSVCVSAPGRRPERLEFEDGWLRRDDLQITLRHGTEVAREILACPRCAGQEAGLAPDPLTHLRAA